MNTSEQTPANLKLQARRLRDYFAGKNIEISHAMALEALAKQHGFRDWNVLSATLNRQAEQKAWPELEDRIRGNYLGHSFQGKILKVETTTVANSRRYTILFDQPIDVVASAHFSSYRKQINCFLNQNLVSIDHKGRPDNILQII